MHQKNILHAGNEIGPQSKVLIMLHGRGGDAANMLSLQPYLKLDSFSLLAPQATNNTWYPYSFLAPASENEPWLSSALDMLTRIVKELNAQDVSSGNIFFLGFSQGACLMLEFLARNAAQYGGAVAFTGGLIGEKIERQHYAGDFQQTPFFIGSANPDPHVPVERVYATGNILREMNAVVHEKIYADMGHTISQDEIDNANELIFAPRLS